MLRILGCLFLVIWVSGCGLSNMQMVNIQSFGTATEKVGSFGEKEFINIRKGIIEMNKTLISIDVRKKTKNWDFDAPVSVELTAQRIAASKALKLYGQLLVLLVTEDRTANLQSAANALLKNTTMALGKELSTDHQSAVSQVIVGLGSFWLEKQKADAIKAIVPAYATSINDLANLLLQDFSVDARATGYLKAYASIANRLKNTAMRVVDRGDQYSFAERERAVNAFVMAQKALIRSVEIDKRANVTLASLKAANAELVQVMADQQSVDPAKIKQYVKQVQVLSGISDMLAQ